MQSEHADRIRPGDGGTDGPGADWPGDDLRRPDPPSATRLNRLAVVVAAAVMSVTLLVIAFAIGGQGGEEVAEREEQTRARRIVGANADETFYDRPFDADTVQRVDLMTGLAEGGYGDSMHLEDDPAVSQDRVPPPYGVRPSYAENMPYGPTGGFYEAAPASGPQPRQPSPEEQALERAMHAALTPQGLSLGGGRSTAASSVGAPEATEHDEGMDPLDEAYLEALSAMQNVVSLGTPPDAAVGGQPPTPSSADGPSAAGAMAASPSERARQFVQDAVAVRGADGNYIATTLERPISAYEVREGTLVEALLVTGIHSDLPGEVVAQVARNVYDSQTQQVVLIPKGTRLIGTYDNQIALDQSRLLVAWTRMVFPDGRSVNLPGLGSKDGAGATGLSGRVNRHYWQAFGNALMLAVVGGGLSYATSRQRQGGAFGYPTPGEIMAGSVATELSRVATEILRGSVMRRPTIRIREGTPFNVFMNGDLALLPYASQDGFLQTRRRTGAGASGAAEIAGYRR